MITKKQKESAVIIYSNLWIPHLSTDTMNINETVKKRTSVTLTMSEFEYYMTLNINDKVDFLINNSDFNTN